MENKILGLHHITAIANNAKRNHDFYTRILGVRLVKKTVNFDDPGTYHFYFGDEVGTPGTIPTFLPWEGIGQGRTGTGMATHIGYAIPKGSIKFWEDRLTKEGVEVQTARIFDEETLSFEDPDGLQLQFSESGDRDDRLGWATDEIAQEVALKGFKNVTLTLNSVKPTAHVLTEVLGYTFEKQEGNRYRYITEAIGTANIVDIIEQPDGKRGYGAGGTNHHIAFRVSNDEILMDYREKVIEAGLDITPKIDRDYFFSLYFREPGGVLFELATDNPGFTKDEPKEDLGRALKLPARYEGMRSKIEAVLPKL